jgi:DNA mismatch repair protein MutS2
VHEVVDSLDLTPQEDSEPRFAEGDVVSIAGSAVKGPIVELNEKKGEAILEVHGKRVAARLNKLVQSGVEQSKPFDPLAQYRRKTFVPESDAAAAAVMEDALDSIDLHGQTTEEAYESLELFLSRCLERNIDRVRVMHGIGTGRLRAFVQDYLRKHVHVSKVQQAEPADGGYGVTIAVLK